MDDGDVDVDVAWVSSVEVMITVVVDVHEGVIRDWDGLPVGLRRLRRFREALTQRRSEQP